jgi:hypothetical protein
VLEETDVEEFIDIIVREVELLKVLKSLNTLNFFQFTSGQVKNSDEFEGRTDISEALDNGIVHLQIFERGQNFSYHLQVMTRRVHS